MSYKMIFEFGRALIAFTPGGFCDYTEEVPTNGLHSHHTYELAFVMPGTGIFFMEMINIPLRGVFQMWLTKSKDNLHFIC